MENMKKANLTENELNEVSGGVDPSNILKTMCGICKKNVSKLQIVNYNNRPVCKECMEKINNR